MADQSNSSAQSAQTPAELRQHILEQLNTNMSIIEELNDEELEIVGGAAGITGLLRSANQVMERNHGWDYASSAALSTIVPQLLSKSSTP